MAWRITTRHYVQARSQDFSWGGGGCIWGVKMQTSRGVRSGGMLPRENFRKFGVPWTAFYAFCCGTKREIEYRVVKRRSKSPSLDRLKIQHRASHLSNRFPNKI